MGEPVQARYQGHLNLPEVGAAGQRRLAAASVLCVGTGGLGSPAALYLAAAGIGRLGLVDADEVDVTNLHRQVLFRTQDVGEPKVEVARRTLAALNPEVDLVIHPDRLTHANADRVLGGYDVILDGTDNFPTRYLVNDACVRLGKPDVWASVYRFEGQVAVFDARRGPCYRCLFPEVPPDDAIPACSLAGVLGVLPGILGTMQALEAIKLVLEAGDPLIGRLLTFDALGPRWTELALEKDPACPACGPDAVQGAKELDGMDPRDLARLLAGDAPPLLVDCREPFELEICALPNAVAIPLRELGTRTAELDRDRPVVVVCHRGPRAYHAAIALRMAGFRDATYLEGGLHAWSIQVDRAMPRY